MINESEIGAHRRHDLCGLGNGVLLYHAGQPTAFPPGPRLRRSRRNDHLFALRRIDLPVGNAAWQSEAGLAYGPAETVQEAEGEVDGGWLHGNQSKA